MHIPERQFLSLKEEFLDVVAALEAVRRAAEAAGRVPPPDSPVAKAVNALMTKMKQVSDDPETNLKLVAWHLRGGTDVYLASEFTPDTEHLDDWMPLYSLDALK